MYYRILKLKFTEGVHFGDGSLDGTESAFSADMFFSALCIEALLRSDSGADELKAMVLDGKVLFSDAFPYRGGELYVPKPVMHIEGRRDNAISERKRIKKIRYIPFDDIGAFVEGSANLASESYSNDFGAFNIQSRVMVGTEQTEPYRVKSYRFYDDCGLYIIAGYEDEISEEYIDELMEGLSYSGIGGKRSSGYGRFEYYKEKVSDELQRRLSGQYSICMSLSVSLPKDEELSYAIENADYLLLKRGGFVQSETYSAEYVRKKDTYAFKAGSCFENRFMGDIYDVSSNGTHPVYRYLKPMFIGVRK